jgi:protein-disulfide isomerase
MRKVFIILPIVITILLAGCLPQNQATPTATPTKARPAPTAVLAVPSQAPQSPQSGCTVITQKPTPGPTAVSVFPPVSASDWTKGPASAKVTIIEYSDFQ